jgi:alkanesulfonate monooxygenase SsuD/methylene tetrahydromethanopterin reductase-like flavin-dependent oxidoreductase (luciferase family)
VSATLNLLTVVGARTSSPRLGTAVLVLPWHNPVPLAEQAATLDLSGGRLDFWYRQGLSLDEFAGFCLPMEEADERFEESLSVIIKAWTSDKPSSHRGRYWRFENISVEPPTVQKPQPPFWMGAGSPESMAKIAARGHNLLHHRSAPRQRSVRFADSDEPKCPYSVLTEKLIWLRGEDLTICRPLLFLVPAAVRACLQVGDAARSLSVGQKQ